jgi:hypothetical protein
MGRGTTRRATWVLAGAAILGAAVSACGGLGYGFPEPDPNVRGGMPEFSWSSGEAGPQQALVPPDRAGVTEMEERLAGVVDPALADAFPIRVIALFPTPEAAEEQAEAIRETLAASARWFADPANADARAALLDPDRIAPLSEPEVAAVLAAGTPPRGRGYGWGGGADDVDAAVVTIGPFLVVTGFESDWVEAEVAEHPLVVILNAYGGVAMLENDLTSEGGPIIDLSCRPADDARAAALLDLLGDTIETSRYHATPPWVAEPTPAQALARATVRRWRMAGSQAMSDPEFRGYVDRLTRAIDDPEAYQAVVAEMGAWIARRSAELVEGEVDPETLALVAAQPQDQATDAYATWLREIGERLGQVPLQMSEAGYLAPDAKAYGQTLWFGTVRVEDGRLEAASLSFGRFSTGGLEMLAWLGEQGCTDLRIGLVDYYTAFPD